MVVPYVAQLFFHDSFEDMCFLDFSLIMYQTSSCGENF